jgi:hypothetical protein
MKNKQFNSNLKQRKVIEINNPFPRDFAGPKYFGGAIISMLSG